MFAKLTVRSSGIVSVCLGCSGRPSGKSASAASTSSSNSVAATVLSVSPKGFGFVTFVQSRTVAPPRCAPPWVDRMRISLWSVGRLLESNRLNQRA